MRGSRGRGGRAGLGRLVPPAGDGARGLGLPAGTVVRRWAGARSRLLRRFAGRAPAVSDGDRRHAGSAERSILGLSEPVGLPPAVRGNDRQLLWRRYSELVLRELLTPGVTALRY